MLGWVSSTAVVILPCREWVTSCRAKVVSACTAFKFLANFSCKSINNVSQSESKIYKSAIGMALSFTTRIYKNLENCSACVPLWQATCHICHIHRQKFKTKMSDRANVFSCTGVLILNRNVMYSWWFGLIRLQQNCYIQQNRFTHCGWPWVIHLLEKSTGLCTLLLYLWW